MTQPDLVETGGRPRSRRTTTVAAAVVVTLVVLIAWRTVSDPEKAPPQARVTDHAVAQPTPSPSGPPSDAGAEAAALDAWLDTLPQQIKRPATYSLASTRDFRVLHSGGFTGAEDYAAVAQLRDAAGHWVVVAHGDVAAHPPLDASGKFVAFTVGRANLTKRSISTWVYVVRRADARVLTRLRVDRARFVAGWLGDRVVLPSYDDGGPSSCSTCATALPCSTNWGRDRLRSAILPVI